MSENEVGPAPSSEPHGTTEGQEDQHPTRRLLRQGSAYTASRALQIAASVLLVPLLTRIISQAEYGALGLSMLLVQLVALIGTAGLPAVITREFYSRDGLHRARQLIGCTSLIAVGTGVAAFATGPIWVRLFDGLTFESAVQLSVVSAVAVSVVSASQSYLQAGARVGRFVLISLVVSVGAQVSGLLLVSVGDPTASSYMRGYTVCALLAMVIGLRSTGMERVHRADRPFLRQSLSIALPTLPHSLGLVLLAIGDRFVIERVEGLAAVGQYQAGYALGGLVLVGLAAFNNAWAPLIYGAPELDRWDRLASTGHDVHRLVALTVCVVTLSTSWALSALLPASYDVDVLADVASVVAFAAVPYVVYLANVHVLFQEGRTRSLAMITPAAFVLNAGANLVLVPIAGIRAAAFTTVGSYAVQAALVHIAARRHATVPWQPHRMVIWSLVAGIACAIAFLVPAHGLGLVLRVCGVILFGCWLAEDVRRSLRVT